MCTSIFIDSLNEKCLLPLFCPLVRVYFSKEDFTKH